MKKFQDRGGLGVINVGMNQDADKKALQIAHASSDLFPDLIVKATLGIHPYEVANNHLVSKTQVDEMIKNIIHQIEKENKSGTIIAVGECGIDAHYQGYDSTKALQSYAFQAQCDVATTYNLPVVIHSRDHFQDTTQILKKNLHLNTYMHCRGYGPEQIVELCSLYSQNENNAGSLRIGFCGNVTYPKADILRESFIQAWKLQEAGKCRILLETDAPFLAPQLHRGTTNEPSFVVDIYKFISQEFYLDLKKLQEIIASNRKAFAGVNQ